MTLLQLLKATRSRYAQPGERGKALDTLTNRVWAKAGPVLNAAQLCPTCWGRGTVEGRGTEYGQTLLCLDCEGWGRNRD